MAAEEIEHIYLDQEPEPPVKPHHHVDLHPAVESEAERKKLMRTLLAIAVTAFLLSFIRGLEVRRVLADFLAVFLFSFSAFKFTHIEAFAFAYRTYDSLSQHIRPWAYIVPFIEAFISFWYLLSEAPNRLNIIALLVALPAAYSAHKALGHKKSSALHTSLGGVFHWPLIKLTYFEHMVLIVIAVVLLFV